MAASPVKSPSMVATPPPPAAVLFENVRVFDGTSEQLSPPRNVLVVGNKVGDYVVSEVVGETVGDIVGSEEVGDVVGGVVGSEVVGEVEAVTGSCEAIWVSAA